MKMYRRSLAAAVSLLTSALALVGAVLYLLYSPLAAVASLVTVTTAMIAGFYAAGHRRNRLIWAALAAVSLVVSVVLHLRSGPVAGLALLDLALALLSIVFARVALRHGITAERHATGVAVPPAKHPVLLVNPRSGDGKAARIGLPDAARHRGIKVLEVHAGDDLERLAERAVTDGADVIGMAGGDGSQALVARVAARRGVPMVCIASGTRNHFAADLGIDRDDVLAGLDAFDEAIAARVDMGRVVDATGTERPFVNNVVMGVYGKAVHSPGYRTAKRQTVVDVLQEYAGPQAFDLRFTGPDGKPESPPDLLFVGNNPYVLTNLSGFGCRLRLNTARLGVVSVRIDHPNQLPELAALEVSHRPELFPGWREWTTTELVVDSGSPLEAGVDGEAAKLSPPARFSSVPGALTVRLARQRPRHRFRRIPAPIRSLIRLANHLPMNMRRRERRMRLTGQRL